MKTKIFIAIIAIIAIGIIACKGDDTPTHTHEWEWVVTTEATTETEGVETETCKTCGETNGTRPIQKLPLLCTCNPKEHYLPCTCGGTDCICEVKPRGTFGNIPIYQTADVSETDAVQATTRIGNAYAQIDDATATYIAANITRIEIVNTGNNVAIDSGVLKIKTGNPAGGIAGDLDDLIYDLLND
jgi:hypothetical protein